MPHRSTSCSKPSERSSRNCSATSVNLSALTTIVNCPRASVMLCRRSPNAASRFALRVSSLLAIDGGQALLTSDGVGADNLRLQLDYAIHERFRCRRATRHIDIDRHDPVTAPHDGVGIVIVTTAVRART